MYIPNGLRDMLGELIIYRLLCNHRSGGPHPLHPSAELHIFQEKLTVVCEEMRETGGDVIGADLLSHEQHPSGGFVCLHSICDEVSLPIQLAQCEPIRCSHGGESHCTPSELAKRKDSQASRSGKVLSLNHKSATHLFILALKFGWGLRK